MGDRKMRKGFKVISLILIIIVITIGATGCGSGSKTSGGKSSVMVPKTNVDKKAIGDFVKAVLPLVQKAEELHKVTRTTVNKYGYAEINMQQAMAEVEKIEVQTKQLMEQLAQIPSQGVLEEIKGELSTSLYLKQQNITKLKKVLQEPNPKSSTLNKILDELQASEGFLEKSKGRIEDIRLKQ
jgi:DNA repair exonuclease SbcCD ATPase subunit